MMMLFQTWVPEEIIHFQPDCNDVPQLRFLSIFLGLVMLALLIIGRITRSFNRMMPYLYRPNRATSPLPVRLFSRLQALLGP
jgi:Na+/H+-dicarboxylate symporter